MKFYELTIGVTIYVILYAKTVQGVGINWGTFESHKIAPNISVQLLKDNGISKVKLFDADETVVSALAGSGIEVMVAITNYMLDNMTDYDKAKEWVKQNVTRYVQGKDAVDITYVAVGNEPFLDAYSGLFTNVTFPALKNIRKALDEAGLSDKVKTTIPLNADVYNSPESKPVPSAGAFRSDISDLMTEIVQFYKETNSSFMVNIYPFLSLYNNTGFPVDYAFFDGFGSPIVDNGLQYENVFDANYDTLVSALAKANCTDLPIIVGEIGWPTDGDSNANATLAKRFYDGLLKKLATKQGTPLRPNATIDVYLFSLYDEDGKSILPGDFERHWGVFGYDGRPKFNMDLAGKSDDGGLVGAKGVEYYPTKWCVVDPSAKDLSKLDENAKYACAHADCTSLGNGSSCGGLDDKGRASYAFNMYFQNSDQVDGSCGFDGLAMVTDKNASSGACNFMIQIVGYVPPGKSKSSGSGSSSPASAPMGSGPGTSDSADSSKSSSFKTPPPQPLVYAVLCLLVSICFSLI